MEIKITLGFSHIRDSIKIIDEVLANMEPSDYERISLQHLRDALMQALPIGMQRNVIEFNDRTEPSLTSKGARRVKLPKGAK